ncbi:MAG TPA: hypothetical protein VFW83_10845 [Bryobacteraceae bacterium]|nr:hypothetical protein [Bryobacteraceae bacterium]
MRRPAILALGAICAFAAAAAILMKLMPSPLKDSDYLVIGSVATLVALLALFFGLVSASARSGDTFFKKRKKRR